MITAEATLRARLLGLFGWTSAWDYTVTITDPMGSSLQVVLPNPTTDYAVPFPGLTTLTTLLIHTDHDLTATFGAVETNEAKTLKAMGLVGFVNGELAAAEAVTVSFADDDPAVVATVTLLWIGH